MFITYICILISLYFLLQAFYELIYILIYGDLPQKKVVFNYFEKLDLYEGEEQKRKKTFQQKVQKVLLLNQLAKKESLKKVNPYLILTFLYILCFFVGFIFFQSWFYAILFGFLGLVFPRYRQQLKAEKLHQKMLLQFREAIMSISNSLKAGSSLQVALLRCQEDLAKQLGDSKEKPILIGIEDLNRDIQFGLPIERALEKFSQSFDLEEVHQFVSVTIITKSKGGNLPEVIENTTQMITDKITIQQEIWVATSQKRAEARVLTFMPVGVVSAILLLNPGYMTPMYESWIGSTLLFMASIMLIANYFIARSIISIKV